MTAVFAKSVSAPPNLRDSDFRTKAAIRMLKKIIYVSSEIETLGAHLKLRTSYGYFLHHWFEVSKEKGRQHSIYIKPQLPEIVYFSVA